jgi:hypothetical protein
MNIFRWAINFFKEKDCIAIEESFLSPIVSNIYVKHCGKLSLCSAWYKLSLWFRYTDDKYLLRPLDPERLKNFFSHRNSSRLSSQFTIDTETQTAIPSLGVIIIKKCMTLATNVYRRNTRTGRYFNFISNWRPYVEQGSFRVFTKNFHQNPRRKRPA